MSQQVNLYHPMFRREKKVFSAAAMLQLGLLVAVSLLGIWSYFQWQTGLLEDNVTQLEAERDTQAQNLSRISAEYPARQKSKVLEGRIATVSRELEQQSEVQRALERGDVGTVGGFAAHFEALARQHVQGTWLTGFNISAGGRVLDLSGSALQAELIPVYIQRLASEPVFAGVSFNVLELNRVEDSIPPRVDFVLRTQGSG